MMKAKNNQSLFDVSVEHCGGVSSVIDIATSNGISITDDVEVGTDLVEVSISDKKVATLFGNLKHKPATALSDADLEIVDEVGPDVDNEGVFDETFDETYE